jgi:predicted AlkP superfamily pyrophosphatase or phosphodiesterase
MTIACAGAPGGDGALPQDDIAYDPLPDCMAGAPELSITRAYHDALRFLEGGERVLVILLDGWGWEMFRHHMDRQPFLSGLNPLPALSVYPPITPVALASIVTGQQPDVHGIHSRSDRRMNDGVTDIFDAARGLGRTAAYVQSDSNIIETSLMPVFSPDADGLYGTDNEVFENAKRFLNADFLFVHFHGIDDEAHTYGPFTEEVGARMAHIDEYVRFLAENWESGKVIIVADHGQHNVYDDPSRLGNHYKLCHVDMIVPYIIAQGGTADE